jgi:hypothetical protein
VQSRKRGYSTITGNESDGQTFLPISLHRLKKSNGLEEEGNRSPVFHGIVTGWAPTLEHLREGHNLK